MRTCSFYRLLYNLVPLNAWKYFLLQSHMEKCEMCRKEVAGISEAQYATVSRSRLERKIDLWPGISHALNDKSRPHKRASFRHWIWATAGSLAVAAGLVLLMINSSGNGTSYPEIKFRLDYVRIYEEPAQAFIFKTQDANRTFVWVEKQNQGEVQ